MNEEHWDELLSWEGKGGGTIEYGLPASKWAHSEFKPEQIVFEKNEI